jgi:hypothetical protein
VLDIDGKLDDRFDHNLAVTGEIDRVPGIEVQQQFGCFASTMSKGLTILISPLLTVASRV